MTTVAVGDLSVGEHATSTPSFLPRSALTCLSAEKPAALRRGLSRSQHSGTASVRGRRDRKRDRELFLRLLPHASGAGSSYSCHRLWATNRRGHLHPRPLNLASALAPHPGSRKCKDRKCGVLSPGQPLPRSQAGLRHVSMVRARLPGGWVLSTPPRAAAL